MTFNCIHRSPPSAALLGAVQLFQAYHTVHPLPLARPELAKVCPTTITLLSRQGRPPSCLPVSVGHRDDVETRGRSTGPQLLIHLPHPPISQPGGEAGGSPTDIMHSLPCPPVEKLLRAVGQIPGIEQVQGEDAAPQT